MLVFESRLKELKKKYEKLLKEFARYKSLYNYQNCNKALRYEQLMARAIKLKKENVENSENKSQLYKMAIKLKDVTQKLEEMTNDRDNLKANINKIIEDEVNKLVHDEVNLVFRKNIVINEEVLQLKEEMKWINWYLNSLKDIYLSEGNVASKRIILEKLNEGIPECYRELTGNIISYSKHKSKNHLSA